MKKLKKIQYDVRRQRTFSESFKRRKVDEVLQKISTVTEISKEYEVSVQSIYKWIYLYSDMKKKTKVIVEPESDTRKIQELKQKVAELERALGQKQIQLDFMNKMVELAEEKYKIDIKKKNGGQP
jgi:transposase